MSDNTARQELLDIKALMAKIREEIISNESILKKGIPAFNLYKAENGRKRKPGEVVHSEDLRQLNLTHVYPTASFPGDFISSHRPGKLGKLIVKVKRKILNSFWEPVSKSYIEREKEFIATLVRVLNTLSLYVDERDTEILVDLVKKIDADSGEVKEKLDSTVEQVTLELTRALEKCRAMEKRQVENTDRIKRLDDLVLGLESLIVKLAKPEAVPVAESCAVPDPSYLLFENRFRGSEELVRERMEAYAPYLREVPAGGKILDIGCGRGELLSVVKEIGKSGYGVDMDQGMVKFACGNGLDVQYGNGIAHLAGLQSNSLSAVCAIQVVEHLPFKVLLQLLEQAFRTLQPGGIIIFETINPNSMVALYSNYFRDLTHVFPVHPETISYLASQTGFKDIEIKYSSEFPANSVLQKIDGVENFAPSLQGAMQVMNQNISHLNSLLFGSQDYAIIAKKQ